MAPATGISLGAATAIAEKFPWRNSRTFVDVGAAEGALAVTLARVHPHLAGTGFDLPAVRPHFETFVARQGLSDRLSFHAGDFFAEPLPEADAIVMGHVLHDWSLDNKRQLIEKAYRALPR